MHVFIWVQLEHKYKQYLDQIGQVGRGVYALLTSALRMLKVILIEMVTRLRIVRGQVIVNNFI